MFVMLHQQVEERKRKYWGLAVQTLHAAGGPPGRTAEAVKRKWQDLKVKANKLESQAKGTGKFYHNFMEQKTENGQAKKEQNYFKMVDRQ